jgi:hypothetical protein
LLGSIVLLNPPSFKFFFLPYLEITDIKSDGFSFAFVVWTAIPNKAGVATFFRRADAAVAA